MLEHESIMLERGVKSSARKAFTDATISSAVVDQKKQPHPPDDGCG